MIRRAAQAGFSLIELLVVMAIIAASVGIVQLAIPDLSDEEAQAQQFAGWLAQCQFEAQTSGQVLGVAWLHHEDDDTQAIARSLRLNPRQSSWTPYQCNERADGDFVFADTVTLLIDGEQISSAAIDPLAQLRAAVVISPSTGHTPFNLEYVDGALWQTDGLTGLQEVGDER